MTEPPWLTAARESIGLREVPGAETAPVIAKWLVQLGAWWADDETPWCGTAVAAWLRASGRSVAKNWFRAKGWLEWGLPIDHPCPGAVVVFSRDGGGHVGIVVGRDEVGRLLVIGGNQGNAVKISPFDTDRVIGYRWPVDAGLAWQPDLSPLPVYASAGEATSRSEA
jgi:uncharacterized protein (TIGR02594 family)